MNKKPGLHTLANMPIEEKKAFMAEVMAEARELQEQKLEEARAEDVNSFNMRCAGGGLDDVCETFRGLLIASFYNRAKTKWLHDNGRGKDYELDDEEYDAVLEIVDDMLMSHVILVNALAMPHDDSACTNDQLI